MVVANLPAVNGDNTSLGGSLVYNFTAGDYLEVFAYQNSGGNLNLQFAGTTLQFTFLGA